jgi:hypothetical protein
MPASLGEPAVGGINLGSGARDHKAKGRDFPGPSSVTLKQIVALPEFLFEELLVQGNAGFLDF